MVMADHIGDGVVYRTEGARCPGHTCELGRTQDWIAGAGKIDGQYSDLPPGHFWHSAGGYLAHGKD